MIEVSSEARQRAAQYRSHVSLYGTIDSVLVTDLGLAHPYPLKYLFRWDKREIATPLPGLPPSVCTKDRFPLQNLIIPTPSERILLCL